MDYRQVDGIIWIKNRVLAPLQENPNSVHSSRLANRRTCWTNRHLLSSQRPVLLARHYEDSISVYQRLRYLQTSETISTRETRSSSAPPDTRTVSVGYFSRLHRSSVQMHFLEQYYEYVMVVVDRLSKTKKFVPMTDIKTETVVSAFFHWVWRSEGFPLSIVLYRGSQFVSYFWKRLYQRLGATPRLSTAFHPETDGQTEVANHGLK